MVTENQELEYEPSVDEISRALEWDADDGDDEADSPQPAAVTQVPSPSETQAPPVTPVPEPTPVPQPSPVPDPFAQAREAELQQLKEQQAISQINGQAYQYMNTLVSQGWDESSARTAATQFAQSEYNKHQLAETQRVANEAARQAKAYEYHNQYGAPVDWLQGYNDPSSMEQAAKMWQATQGEIQQLRKQITNPAPVQSFDNNRMTASNSASALKVRYATDPNFNPTEEQLARILGH